jgi:lipopolysaccharide/colanic/teichoic acid biosynthesis glycosyltransferase
MPRGKNGIAAVDAANAAAKCTRKPAKRAGEPAKRALDIFGSVLGIAALSPLLVATALLVRATMGRPVLFRQKRPGLQGEPFILIKFRTMRDLTDGSGRPAPDAARLTRLGRFLRAASLDELPELLNVLKGDMSLVGPRPLLMDYMNRYGPEQARRHEVKPGITGWAQVNGRNALGWEEKFRLDVWYVDHQNLLLDLRILFMTLLHILKRKDVSAAGHATMPEFTGAAEPVRPAESACQAKSTDPARKER